LRSGDKIITDSVILAMGAVGKPIIPKRLMNIPPHRLMHWKNLDPSIEARGIPSDWKDILVVGGGLTGVQVAQLALRHGPNDRKVTLCSRRPIVEKFLDIDLEWLNRRQAHKCQSDFYHQSLEDRQSNLKRARGGGSVPPWYVRQIEKLESNGRLQRLVGNPNFIYDEELLFRQEDSTRKQHCNCCRKNAPLAVGIGSKIHRFDGVLIACGVQPDCSKNHVYQSVLEKMKHDEKVYKGLPIINEDLEWYPNIFVIGGMAGLNLGPDAGNLMGMRRGATIIANTLGCRSWLRDKGNLYANRYIIFEDDETSDTDAESD
jgi:hypothetical protein